MIDALARRRQLAGLVLRHRRVALTGHHHEYYIKKAALDICQQKLEQAESVVEQALLQAAVALREGAALDMHILASSREVVAVHEAVREKFAELSVVAEGDETAALLVLKDSASEVRAAAQLEADLKGVLLRRREKDEERQAIEGWLLKGGSHER